MSADQSGALKILVAIVLGLMFLAAGITGRPGSIIGALIDAEDMEEGSP